MVPADEAEPSHFLMFCVFSSVRTAGEAHDHLEKTTLLMMKCKGVSVSQMN